MSMSAKRNSNSAKGVAAENIVSKENLSTKNISTESNISAENPSTKNISTESNISGENMISAENPSTKNISTESNISGENMISAENPSTKNISTESNISGENISAENPSTKNISTESNISGENMISAENPSTKNISTETNISGENMISAENPSTKNLSTESLSIIENISAENISAENRPTKNISTESLSIENMSAENLSTKNISTETNISAGENMISAENPSTKNLSTESLPIENVPAENLSVNLSTILGDVLDHTDLRMKDCTSLQLVSRSMNVVVSQFYPHVQSVARLGLTDRVVARALKSPEIFFRKFPVMNDLHVPWNPPIIDSSAAIPITDAVQLLTDYPQIRALSPMYLEREGLEGLGGHSLRSVTFYPGRYEADETLPQTWEDLNPTVDKLRVEQLEIVSNCEILYDLMMKLIDKENLKTLRQFILIDIEENPETIDPWHELDPRPKYCIDKAIGFDCMKNITDLSIWFQSFEQVRLWLKTPKIEFEFPYVKAVHFERVCTDKMKMKMKMEDENDLEIFTDVEISEDVLSTFPNLEKLTAPRSCMVLDFNPHPIRFGPAGRNYNDWIEKMIPIIFSSGIGAVIINYDNCVKSKNTDMLEEYLRACKTNSIRQLDFRRSFLLTHDDLQRFIVAFPKLEGLYFSSRCALIGNTIFNGLAKANLWSLTQLDLNGTSCTLEGVRKYIVWRHRQIEVLKKKMAAVRLILPFGISRLEMIQSLKEHVFMGAKIDVLNE